MTISYRLMLMGLFCVVLGTSLRSQDAPKVVLAIPGVLSALEDGEVGEIPHPTIEELRITLSRPRASITTGSVAVRLNANSIPSTVRDDPASGRAMVIVKLSDSARPLSPTINTVEVTFEERYVESPRYAYFVLNVRSGASEQPPTTAATPGRRYALVVGVSTHKYVGEGLGNLAYAARDAVDVHGVLTNPGWGGIPAARACLLADENATLENVRRVFTRLGSETQPNDVVFVFFSGQVLSDPKRSGTPTPVVVLHDSKPGEFSTTGLPLTELEALYGKTLLGRTVVTFVDAGRRREGTVSASGGQLGNELWLARATASGGVGFAAAGPSQISKESPQFGGGHGLFGFTLAEGLRGEADTNRDGTVVVEELAAYLGRQYRERADEGSRLAQTARTTMGDNGQLPLSGRSVVGRGAIMGRGAAQPAPTSSCAGN